MKLASGAHSSTPRRYTPEGTVGFRRLTWFPLRVMIQIPGQRSGLRPVARAVAAAAEATAARRPVVGVRASAAANLALGEMASLSTPKLLVELAGIQLLEQHLDCVGGLRSMSGNGAVAVGGR
jgi:hypothetical protein